MDLSITDVLVEIKQESVCQRFISIYLNPSIVNALEDDISIHSNATSYDSSFSLGAYSLLPATRNPSFIIGYVRELGKGVKGIEKNALVCAYLPPNRRELKRIYNSSDKEGNENVSTSSRFVKCDFTFFIPFPHPILGKQNEFLTRLSAVMPRLLEGLFLSQKMLRLKKNDSLAICCESLNQVLPLLQWVLPLNIRFFIFSRLEWDCDWQHHPFFAHPSIEPYVDQVVVMKLDYHFSSRILEITNDLGVRGFLLASGAGDYLVSQIAFAKALSNREGKEFRHRSLLSACLQCLAVGGVLCVSDGIELVDEYEVLMMKRKMLSISFLGSSIYALSSYGSLSDSLHMLLEIIKSVAESAVWTPPLGTVKQFPFSHRRDAEIHAFNNYSEFFILSDSPTLSILPPS